LHGEDGRTQPKEQYDWPSEGAGNMPRDLQTPNSHENQTNEESCSLFAPARPKNEFGEVGNWWAGHIGILTNPHLSRHHRWPHAGHLWDALPMGDTLFGFHNISQDVIDSRQVARAFGL
jgi:hypothetical protein